MGRASQLLCVDAGSESRLDAWLPHLPPSRPGTGSQNPLSLVISSWKQGSHELMFMKHIAQFPAMGGLAATVFTLHNKRSQVEISVLTSQLTSLFFFLQMTFFEGRISKELKSPDLEAVACFKQGLQEADNIKVWEGQKVRVWDSLSPFALSRRGWLASRDVFPNFSGSEKEGSVFEFDLGSLPPPCFECRGQPCMQVQSGGREGAKTPSMVWPGPHWATRLEIWVMAGRHWDEVVAMGHWGFVSHLWGSLLRLSWVEIQDGKLDFYSVGI